MKNTMNSYRMPGAFAEGYRAAIYCRLSKDDDLQGESASIANHDVMYRGWITPKNITS